MCRKPLCFLPALVKPRSSRCLCTGFTIQLMRGSCRYISSDRQWVCTSSVCVKPLRRSCTYRGIDTQALLVLRRGLCIFLEFAYTSRCSMKAHIRETASQIKQATDCQAMHHIPPRFDTSGTKGEKIAPATHVSYLIGQLHPRPQKDHVHAPRSFPPHSWCMAEWLGTQVTLRIAVWKGSTRMISKYLYVESCTVSAILPDRQVHNL